MTGEQDSSLDTTAFAPAAWGLQAFGITSGVVGLLTLQIIAVGTGWSQSVAVLQSLLVAYIALALGWRVAIFAVGLWLLVGGAAIAAAASRGATPFWNELHPVDLLLTGAGWYVLVGMLAQVMKTMHAYRTAAARDPLTGACNHQSFMQQLRQQCAIARRTGGSLGLIIFDCDRFKQINDQHGHAYGDEVLRGIVQRIQGNVREYDVVGRLGGDEFALLVPAATPAACRRIIHRIRQHVASEWERDSATHAPISITAGAAIASGNAVSAEQVRAWADRQLLFGKRLGRNQYRQVVLRMTTGNAP